ncbi:MAG: hypothetical protein ACPL6D_16490, partial [Thermodesulfobacteriota bacterium]
MVRIGIFIDAMRETIPSHFRKKISSIIQGIPEIAFISEEDDLSSSQSIHKMANLIETWKADRII